MEVEEEEREKRRVGSGGPQRRGVRWKCQTKGFQKLIKEEV